jgi:hypothetical protein
MEDDRENSRSILSELDVWISPAVLNCDCRSRFKVASYLRAHYIGIQKDYIQKSKDPLILNLI